MGPAMPGGISWAAICDWCQFHGLSGDDALFYDSCIRSMDQVYFEWFASKIPKSGK